MTHLLIQLSLLFVTFIHISSGRELTDCYANNLNPYLKFGTKTAYEFVYERPKLRDQDVPNCGPVQVWVLARHGTRYPSAKGIRSLAQLKDLRVEIIKNHEERKNGRLCYADLNSLKSWKFNVEMLEAQLLTEQGFTDMKILAKRLRTKYQPLFKQGYSPNLFQFRHTNTERTRQSARAFAEGLFGNSQEVWIPPPLQNDTIIKPYENCTYWIKKVDKNPENQREPELFKLSEDMLTLIHNVSLRLGFLYDLPIDTIDTIYDMCRYDVAWFVSEKSPWCAAFTRSELKTLEYLEDLKAYYDSGYGDELNLRLGCMPLKDMMERFERLQDGNMQHGHEPLGVFYFTHSATLLMTLARLGIASHGIPLRHDNYNEQSSRDWRTSDISPFAANLQVVFFKCSTGEFNRVMFFLNEKRVDYEGCDVGLCSWSYIRDKFADIVQTCNLDWCHNGSFNTKKTSSFLLFLIGLVVLVTKGNFFL